MDPEKLHKFRGCLHESLVYVQLASSGTALSPAFPKVYHDASHAMDNLAACYGVWNVNAMPKEETEAFILILTIGGYAGCI